MIDYIRARKSGGIYVLLMQIVYTYKYLNNRQDIFMAALEEDNKYVDSLIELLGNEKIKASYEKHYFRKKFNGYTLKFEE